MIFVLSNLRQIININRKKKNICCVFLEEMEYIC